MTKRSIHFFSILFMVLFMTTSSIGQSIKIGIMPYRVLIYNKLSINIFDLRSITSLGSEEDRIEKFEDMLTPHIIETFESSLQEKNIDFVKLHVDSLSKEERFDENQFLAKLNKELPTFYEENPKGFYFPAKDKKPRISNLAEYANTFADKLDTDYLLYVIATGYSSIKKKHIEKSKDFKGTLSFTAMLVNGNTGQILMLKSYSYSPTSSLLLDTDAVKYRPKTIVKAVKYFVKKFAKDLAKYQKKSKKIREKMKH